MCTENLREFLGTIADRCTRKPLISRVANGTSQAYGPRRQSSRPHSNEVLYVYIQRCNCSCNSKFKIDTASLVTNLNLRLYVTL